MTNPTKLEPIIVHNFTCECEEPLRSACSEEQFYKEYNHKKYCVLHFPGEGKDVIFDEALKRKCEAKDYNFAGVWFPHRISFSELSFDEEVNFYKATFNAEVEFKNIVFNRDVSFGGTEFANDVNFEEVAFNAYSGFVSAIFNDSARFYMTIFRKDALFMGASFNGGAFFLDVDFKATAAFTSATFNKITNFIRVDFESNAIFATALFHGYVGFTGTKSGIGFRGQSSLDLDRARIEQPDNFKFHTLSLRPYWFVGVDSRKFNFINIEWQDHLKDDIEKLKQNKVSHPHRLLSIACQQLAVNAEENYRYSEASNFRYWSMDARRLEKTHGFAFWKLSWWYWFASGYGERAFKAFIVLICTWLFFALLYTQVGFVRWEARPTNMTDLTAVKQDEFGAPLTLPRAFTYSLNVITLQKPEPRPATNWAQVLVTMETILGPIQGALLALAIRRQFMR